MDGRKKAGMTKASPSKGRSKKNGELMRTYTIAATPTELRLWKELAAKDNRSLSAWIRLIANQKVVDHEARKLAIENLAAIPAGGAGGDADRG